MKKVNLLIFIIFLSITTYGQQFEESVTVTEGVDLPKVRVGGDFTIQFQALKHQADTARLIPLGKGINLPTANMNLDAVLADGISVNLTTYFSSRHHNEAWVKGGYILIDKLPFVKAPSITKAMDYLTFKAGVMEINYGDAHFRRTDNGKAISNPFVGNYIIDAFTTAPSLEVLFRNKGILLMGGLTTGTLKPALVGYNATSKKYTPYNVVDELGFYGKIGFDRQVTEDFRLRITASGYHVSKHHFGSLYNGDRAGSRFYLVMQRVTGTAADVDPTANAWTGNWGPGFTNKNNSFMLNLFSRFKGLEVFLTYESLKGTLLNSNEFSFNQYAAEGIYRFGGNDQFFAGVRYNAARNQNSSQVDRVELVAGWAPVKSILFKAEYVDQNYSKFDVYGGNAGFNGFMIESTVSF